MDCFFLNFMFMCGERSGNLGGPMKSYAICCLAIPFWLAACDKGSGDKVGQTVPPPVIPLVTPPPVFEKADHFIWPQNVSWATHEGEQPPTFSAEAFCGNKETSCLNSYLNEGQVILTSAVPLRTSGPADVEVNVQYSGWARKFGNDEAAFKWHSFFKLRLTFQTKDANGQTIQGSRIAVLLAREIEDPKVEPWEGEEKSFLYTSGNASDQFQLTGKLPSAAEDIKVQIYDVGATQLQIQKIEIRTQPAQVPGS
jgi:hypothetical protein